MNRPVEWYQLHMAEKLTRYAYEHDCPIGAIRIVHRLSSAIAAWRANWAGNHGRDVESWTQIAACYLQQRR